MRRFGSKVLAAVVAAAALALAGEARAGEPVRLLVEIRADQTTIEAGEQIPVQIVAEDASGARQTGFGGRTVEVSATEGDFALVKAPYDYSYKAPPQVDGTLTVQLRAWLKQSPEVKGQATLTVLPPRPYLRLVLKVPSTSVAPGGNLEIQVLGERRDGTIVLVKDQKIVMGVTRGPGKVEFETQGYYRYTAPGKDEAGASTTALVSARLERYPSVTGELGLVITGEAPPPSQPGGGTQPPPSVQPGGGGTAPPPTQPGGGTKPPETGGKGDDDDQGGVLWPGGNVKLLVWRTKERPEDPWSKKREDLPQAGKPLVARMPYNLLRIQIERTDVAKMELEWYVGEKKGAAVRREGSNPQGKFREEKNKAGKSVAILEFESPEHNKPLNVALLLTLQSGQVLREEFVLQRGRDRDDDGKRDGQGGGKK